MRLILIFFLLYSLQAISQQNQFVQIASLPVETSSAYSFCLNGEIYVGGGGNYSNKFYKYDDQNNSWIQMANIPSSPIGGFSFTINNKAYIGGGLTPPGFLSTAVWSYDPILNSWSQEINFPGTNGYNPASFSINNKGFVVGGNSNGQESSIVWCFDASQNSWIQKQNFPGMPRNSGLGISDQTNGYIIGGAAPLISYNEIWKYDLLSDSWQLLTQFSVGRTSMAGFYMNNEIYFGTGGYSGQNSNQFQKLNCTTGQISSISNSPISVNAAIGNASGNFGYFGTGWNSPNSTSLMYKYIPCETTNTIIDTATCDEFTYNNTTYQQSSVIIDTLQTTTGCDSILTINLIIENSPTAVIDSQDSLILNAPIITGATYQWIFCSDLTIIPNQTTNQFIPEFNGSYAVIITDNCGSDTSECANVNTIGLNELNNMKAQIAPNPSNGEIIIQLNQMNHSINISVTDMQGRILLIEGMDSIEKTIDLNRFSPGTYLINLEGLGVYTIIKE